MAEVEATLDVSSKWEVGMTTANGSYSCTYELPPGKVEEFGDSKNGSRITYIYEAPKFEWSFSPGGGESISESGTNHFTDLGDASKENLTASVNITCTEIVIIESWWTEIHYESEWVPPPQDEKGNDIGSGYWDEWTWEEFHQNPTETETNVGFSVGSASASFEVYTRTTKDNKAFYFDNDVTIQSSQGLTTSKVSSWCTQCSNYLRWDNQDDLTERQKSLRSKCLNVSSNGLITAEWFNNCSSFCGAGVSAIKDQTIITNEIFATLQDKVLEYQGVEV